jgi:hypothetical protein
MRIPKQHLPTVAWSGAAVGAFALGWMLKPLPPASGDPAKAADADPASAESRTAEARHPNLRHGTRTAEGISRDADGLGGEALTPGTHRPLTSERIAELGRAFRAATDPLDQRRIFAQLLDGLTAENALEIRKQIEHLDPSSSVFRDFHFAWGKIDGEAAVRNGAETDVPDMNPALAGWASANPAAAKAFYDSLTDTGNGRLNKSNLKEGMVNGLAISDPNMAASFVYALGAAGDGQAKQWMGVITGKVIQSGGAAAAANWALGLPEGDLRGHALFEVAKAQVRENPAAAAAWAAPLAAGKNGGSIVYGITSEWAARGGSAAVVSWLESLGGNQSASFGPAFAGWTKNDPMAASQRVAAMPPSENRDYAIGGLVYAHRWEDPAATIDWANQISDARRREDVLTLAAEALVRKNRPAAEAWLPTSGLSASAQQRLLRNR